MENFQEYIIEHKLLLVKWIGEWDYNDYVKCMESFSIQIESIDVKKIIQDISRLDYDTNISHLDKMVAIRNEKIKKDFKVVYLTSKPNHIIFSELYSDALPNKKAHQYCSTYKEALKLLYINMTEKELSDRFSALGKE